jgi:hypothetical protein
MPDEKGLEARTDDDGHITPAKNDEQRSADIDEQVRRAREGEVSVGGYDVEPGQYGPGAIATSDTHITPKDDGQTPAEAEARSEAIDAQVAAANSGFVGMDEGVTDSTGGGAITALPGSQLDRAPATGSVDQLDAATHDPAGHDLRRDPQVAAVAGVKQEEGKRLTNKELRAIAKDRGVELKGARSNIEIQERLDEAEAERLAAEEDNAEATRPPASDDDGTKIDVVTSVGPAEQEVVPGHGTAENPAGLKPKTQ